MHTKSFHGKTTLRMLVFILAGVAVGFLFGNNAGFDSLLDHLFAHLDWWDLLILPVLWFIVIVVHETGHVCGGLLSNMRLVLLSAGPFLLRQTGQGLRVQKNKNPAGVGGLAIMAPTHLHNITGQIMIMIAGGPIASLLLVLMCLGLAWLLDGRLMAWAFIAAILSLFVFVITSIPRRTNGFMSDGAQFFAYWRGTPTGQARARVLSLFGMLCNGSRPRDIPSEIYTELNTHAIESNEATTAATAALFSYSHSLDAGNTDQAIEDLERASTYSADIPAMMVNSIHIEQAFHTAINGDSEAAHNLLPELITALEEQAPFSRARAAVELARGDINAARKWIAAARAQIPDLWCAGMQPFEHGLLEQISQRCDTFTAPTKQV